MKLYETLEEAREAAKKMAEVLETRVHITLELGDKYALFGNGNLVEIVE